MGAGRYLALGSPVIALSIVAKITAIAIDQALRFRLSSQNSARLSCLFLALTLTS